MYKQKYIKIFGHLYTDDHSLAFIPRYVPASSMPVRNHSVFWNTELAKVQTTSPHPPPVNTHFIILSIWIISLDVLHHLISLHVAPSKPCPLLHSAVLGRITHVAAHTTRPVHVATATHTKRTQWSAEAATHNFPHGSLANNTNRRQRKRCMSLCMTIIHIRLGKKAKGMQNRSGFTRSGGASCAVYGWSYNGRKLNNALWMKCFCHELLLGKKWSCGLHKMPDNANSNTRTHRWMVQHFLFCLKKGLILLFTKIFLLV